MFLFLVDIASTDAVIGVVAVVIVAAFAVAAELEPMYVPAVNFSSATFVFVLSYDLL